MNPTTYELATLAASQQGTPSQRAKAALDIWKACNEALTREATFQEAVTAEEARRAETLALFADCETVSLENFLRMTMPQSKPEDRARKFRDWTRHSIAFHNKLEGAELEAVTADAIARTRLEGYSSFLAADLAASFIKFLVRDRSEKNTARAKKGAAAKKTLGSVASAKKAPQAKRKPRQAKS